MKSTRQYGSETDLALSMWVKLARAAAVFTKVSVNDIRRYGLTQPQFGALECLGHLGAMNIGDLSRKMLVSGGNMTCVVDNLEKEELVYRTHSESDRRAVVVALTEKGEKLLKDIFPQHAACIREAASVLTREEQEQLSALLKKLGYALTG
jgi:MarR family 2-MHQ and catechol resistance regulon transcriptional repressor